jgi:protein O-mannosyl-transferase
MIKRKKSLDKYVPQAGPKTPALPALLLNVLAGAVLIMVIAFLAYLPCINGEFILDDDQLLTNNSQIKASDGLYQIWSTTEAPDYWPATNTSLWIEWRLWKMNPTGYHVANLILHIVESLLIWLILRRLAIPGAFLAAMIFAVHPVNVESVAWISQRKNTMAMLFMLLSIFWYLKADILSGWRSHGEPTEQEKSIARSLVAVLHSGRGIADQWYWLSLTAFLFAMLSKGSVAVLPVLLLGIVWWLRPLTKQDLARTLPFFAVALALAAVNMWFQTHGSKEAIRSADVAQRLLGAGGVVWFYLYKALLPLDLAFIYPQWHIHTGNLLWWLPLVAALAVTVVLWRNRKGWSRSVFFAWGFFCVALIPVMGFVDVGFMQYSLVADHYQHIAIIGLIALASTGFVAWQKQSQGMMRRAAPALAAAAVVALAILTWRQSECYHDNITLYQTTLSLNPECWMAHNNLGVNMARAGYLPEALEQYNQALQLKDNYPEAENNLGNALVKIGRPDEAVEHYRRALSLQSDYPEAHDNLLNALAMTGRADEAIEYYSQAIKSNPDNLQAHYKLGNVLAHASRLSEAIEHYQQALALAPHNPEVHVNMGNALTRIGRIEEAIEHYRLALRLKPDDNAARVNLISEYVRADRATEAVATAEEALELARMQGQTALAKQIEDWLNAYRSSRPNPHAIPPLSE